MGFVVRFFGSVVAAVVIGYLIGSLVMASDITNRYTCEMRLPNAH
jgi:hypothetical protein